MTAKELIQILSSLLIGGGIFGLMFQKALDVFYNSRKAKDSSKRAHERITELEKRIRELEIEQAKNAYSKLER
jgi:hypothetical protein